MDGFVIKSKAKPSFMEVYSSWSNNGKFYKRPGSRKDGHPGMNPKLFREYKELNKET